MTGALGFDLIVLLAALVALAGGFRFILQNRVIPGRFDALALACAEACLAVVIVVTVASLIGR